MLHVLYNVEPVHLKRRGLAGPPAFCAAVIVLPCLLTHTAVTPVVEPSAWLVYFGLGVLAAGRLLWWSVPDIKADAETGMATAPVRYGAARAVLLGCTVMVAGLVVTTWGLSWRAGAVAAVAGTAAHWVFVGVAATMLGVLARGSVPDSGRMRTRSMSVMLVGDLALTVVALASA
ncbi:UbiA family prenyltransferase [Prauserella oleivorans]